MAPTMQRQQNNSNNRDFPGGPVGKTSRNAGGPGSIPGRGTGARMHAATKSSHASTKDSACHN